MKGKNTGCVRPEILYDLQEISRKDTIEKRIFFVVVVDFSEP